MMISLQTWCLLSLSVLLLLSIDPTETEVVRSMSDCEGFLLNENPPQIPGILIDGKIMDKNRYKILCQTYKNQTRFVTLYDITNKVPVFSAYRSGGATDKRPEIFWKKEPQLEKRDPMSNMWDGVYKNQAADNDYKNTTIYERGQLYPSAHAFNQSDKVSTFTLTNVVPQIKSFNRRSWMKMESCVRCVLQTYCSINNDNVLEGFVVTGAKPGTETLNQRVNIPSVLWSAFCCYSKNKNKWLASAHWGNNTAGNSTSKYLETKTLKELHQELNIEAFPNSPQCPLNETVSEFYPEFSCDKNCHCPPQALTTTAPPTTPSTTAVATLSTNISTTTVPTTTSSTRVTNASVPVDVGSSVLESVFRWLLVILEYALGSIKVAYPEVPVTSQNVTTTTSAFASTLGQTTTPTFTYSATAHPTFSTTTPTTTETQTANFTLISTVSNITAPPQSNITANETTTTAPPQSNITADETTATAPPQSNVTTNKTTITVTVNDTITTFSTATESQTKLPRHPSSHIKLSTVKPQGHKIKEPVLEAEERSIGSSRTPQV
ncbi:uncharacterized protein [Channa argus]|uniref:uncharacterized protein n=1 Tax=Channa argus TaxID=215402 RepID=UPI003520AB69